MNGVERQSSIESEPRTLNNSQIELAREVAIYVMNTRSDEEALAIFTKGLEPVVRCGGGGSCGGGGGGSCGGGGEFTSGADAVQDYQNIREIFTAPF